MIIARPGRSRKDDSRYCPALSDKVVGTGCATTSNVSLSDVAAGAHVVAVAGSTAGAATATARDFRLGCRPRWRLLNVNVSVLAGTVWSSCHVNSREH